MARTHGRIMAAIWSDGDFTAMRGSAQRMFMFLLSQPDLSHAGLLPMRVNRWAKKAEDLNPKGHDALLDYGWTAHAWKTSGGYGGGRGGVGDANRHKERIYFSPACIAEDGGLFDLLGEASA